MKRILLRVWLAVLVSVHVHAETHSLRFFETAMSNSNNLSKFVVVGYVDDTEIIRYSDGSHPKCKVMVSWLQQQGLDYCGTAEMQTAVKNEEDHQNSLKNLINYYNQSKGSFHTLQWIYGCDVDPDQNLLRGYVQAGYDGRDYIALNEDLKTWTAADFAARISRSKLERQGYADKCKAYLEGDCIKTYKQIMQYGKDVLLKKVSPKVYVNRHIGSGGDVTLKCWALNFFPADITITWLLNGEELTQEIELIETRPAGDGTFQKWASITISLGTEQNYTCSVEHDALPQSVTQQWNPSLYSFSNMKSNNDYVYGIVVILVILIGSILIFVKRGNIHSVLYLFQSRMKSESLPQIIKCTEE